MWLDAGGTAMEKESNANLNVWGSLASLLSFVISIALFLIPAIYKPGDVAGMAWKARLEIILELGLIAGILYGFLWSVVAQKIILRTNYGEETSMPSGAHAVALSLCLTLPITCLPPLYELITGSVIISSRHYTYAAIIANAGSAIGHLIWYGIKTIHFSGIREMTFPVGSSPNWKRYLTMEMLATCMHFLSTVAVFRAIAQNEDSIFGPSATVMPTITSGLFFISGICFYSLIKYPQSIEKGGWAQVRGVLAGMLQCIALTGGILM
jgi:hypothetical protein